MAQTFDQYLAESGRQSTLDQLRKSGQYESAKSQYESSGSYGQTPSIQQSSYSQPNFESTLNRALEIQRNAVQPAVQSLQASIPEIQQSYATQRQQIEDQKDPLAARYDALIADIVRRQGVAETGAIKTTSQELGRRGIVGSSGVADVALQEAVQPIQSEYAGLATQAELEKQAGLQSLQQQLTNLTPLEVEATRNVQNAIAQLQAATTQGAVDQAMSQLQLAQNQAAQAESQRQFQESQAFAQKQYEQISLPESQANLANIQSTIANRAASDSGLTADDFIKLFSSNGGSINFAPNVSKLISQGKIDEAINLIANP